MSFVTGFFDDPAAMHELLDPLCANAVGGARRLLAAILRGTERTPRADIQAGSGARRTVAYYQEDSAALLNPRFFATFSCRR